VSERWSLALGAAAMDGDPERALGLFRAFEGWAVAALGPEHPAVAQALVRQAWCEARLGRPDEASERCRRALRMVEAGAGARHPAARQLAAHLAAPSADPPRRLDGLAPFDPMAGDEAAGSEPLPPGAGGAEAHAIAMAMAEMGALELAAEAFEEFERWAAARHGPDHDLVLQSVLQLASCRARLGDYAASCALSERALRMLRRTHPGHPAIEALAERLDATCPPTPDRWFLGLGSVLAAEGRYEEAAGALAAYERWAARELGEEHPAVAQAAVLRAHCHAEAGQRGAARRLYRRALDLAPSAGLPAEVTAEIAAHLARERGGREDAWSEAVRLGDTWMAPSLLRIEPRLDEIAEALDRGGHPDDARSAREAYEAWRARQT
jgi:tetratricopeptide (TPR) repeat protein